MLGKREVLARRESLPQTRRGAPPRSRVHSRTAEHADIFSRESLEQVALVDSEDFERVRDVKALKHGVALVRVSLSSKMLGGASQTVSKIRVKCNGT